MRKLLISLMMIGMSVSCFSQAKIGHWSIIPRLGVDISKTSGSTIYYIEGNDVSDIKAKLKPGFASGVEVECQVSHPFAIMAGVYYIQQGTKYADVSVMEDEVNGFGLSHNTLDLDYIGIPVMGRFFVGGNFSIEVGVMPSLLVKSNSTYEMQPFTVNADGGKTYDKVVNVDQKLDDTCNNFVLNLPVGFSYELENVILSARYSYGITSTFKEKFGKGHHSMIQFSVGYRFEL